MKRIMSLILVCSGIITAGCATTNSAVGKKLTEAEKADIEQQQLSGLKKDLAAEKEALPTWLEVIKQNKNRNDKTKITMPNGAVYTLFQIRHGVYAGIRIIESLQETIAEKEALIVNLHKRKGELWAVPNDGALLKKGQKVLGPDGNRASLPPSQ